MSVQDPPLDQVIARVFEESHAKHESEQRPQPEHQPAQVAAQILEHLASLVERMTYRGDFFLSTLLRFLPLLTTLLLWDAVYTDTDPNHPPAGISFSEMVAYLLLVQISRLFSSMPGLAHGIARDIRDGSLKKYLLQPINMLAYLLSYRMAHKAAYIVMSALPYALLFFVCRDFFTTWQPLETYVAYAVALVLGFIIGFFFEASIGMIGFWSWKWARFSTSLTP